MYGSVYVHMVYSVRAKLAVRITARFAGPRPFCPVSRAPDRRAYRLAGASPCCSCQAAGWPCSYPRGRGGRAAGSARAISSRLGRGGAGVRGRHWDGRPARCRGQRRCARIWTSRRAAASCTKGFHGVPSQGLGRSLTSRGLVMDLSCTSRTPAPVTRRIARLRSPRVAAVRKAPGSADVDLVPFENRIRLVTCEPS
jgi:hypothetical protein